MMLRFQSGVWHAALNQFEPVRFQPLQPIVCFLSVVFV